MKYLKYIAITFSIVVLFSCEKYEPFTFNEKPSFDFNDTLSSAPVGFIAEGEILNRKLTIYLMGSTPEEDITLNLGFGGSAKNGVHYNAPSQIIFPKGKIEASLEYEIINTQEVRDLDFTIEILVSDSNVKGINPRSRIKIEYGMPTQWVGYSNQTSYFFNNEFTKCTKAKYQFFYDTFGFYDFTTLPQFSDLWGSFLYTIRALKSVANQQIDIQNAARAEQGLNELKDDNGSNLRF